VTRLLRAIAIGLLLASVASPTIAQQQFITVASTTSTEESGLFGFLLPAFTKQTGIEVRVVAVGTGQALKIGERGDCDVVFVHDRPAELAFVERGFGIDRREVMYNDFILVGPASDPAASTAAETSWQRSTRSRRQKRHSSRAATTAARAKRNSASGRKPRSIPRR
jgi:tungstate transport system substrate-binding protein